MPIHSIITYYPIPSYSVRYTFSAKEKDEETGYSYFGARYYNSTLSVWLSVDPMADKYPNTSPYTYCRNNPIMLIDPNGMWDGDFFDHNGIYLGTDGIDDGKVYIIKREDWKLLYTFGYNLGMTFLKSPELGYSKAPSKVNLSDKAMGNILSHYNSTGLTLTIKNDNTENLFSTYFEGIGNNYSKTEFYYPRTWKKITLSNPGTYLDNYFDIQSAFDNEVGHLTQFGELGGDAYSVQTDPQREEYAISYQQNQPNYQKTSSIFKKQTDYYLRTYK